MKEIDFLPKAYHDRMLRENVRISRSMIIAVLLISAAVPTVFQVTSLLRLRSQQAALESDYLKVKELEQQAQQIRIEVEQQSHHARLLTFLRTPYSRSHILAAIARPMPEEIVITNLRLHNRSGQQRSRSSGNEEEQNNQSAIPYQADLQVLIAQERIKRCTIQIEGTTQDTSALYTFLADLHKSQIIQATKIISIDPHIDGFGREISNFQAHIQIKKGHAESYFADTVSTAHSGLGEGVSR